MGSSEAPKSVVIVGSGISGLTAAVSLLQQHDIPLDIHVFERRPYKHAMSGSGGIMIQENAIRALHALTRTGKDVMSRIRSSGGDVIDGGVCTRTGKVLYFGEAKHRSHAANTQENAVAIMRTRLQNILYNAVLEAAQSAPLSSVTFHFDCELTALEMMQHNLVKAAFSDGSERVADVLIGADGINSSVRAFAHGNEALPKSEYSGQTCWVGSVSASVLDEVPDSLKSFTWCEIWAENSSRFGYFSSGTDDLCWYAFQESERGLSDEKPVRAVLSDLFCQPDYEFPSIVSAIINAIPEDHGYRQDICDRDIQWGSGPVTLVGDAAHPIYPTIGQGGCLGMEDCVGVAGKLIDAWRSNGKQSVPNALREFEDSRDTRVHKMRKCAKDFLKSSRVPNPVLRFFRDAIFQLMPRAVADGQFLWMFSEYSPIPVQ